MKPRLLLGLSLLVFLGSSRFAAHAQDEDWHYSTEMRFYPKFDKESVTAWTPSLSELAGTYEGRGVFEGNRRFNSYERSYQIKVTIDNPSADVSPVNIQWQSRTEKWDGNDGSTADQVNFSVRDAWTNGSEIWGSMGASVNGRDEGPQYPFLAIPSERNGIKGLLLIGRYEGPIFLAKSH